MDAVSFETWLDAIAALSETQRQRAFRALALSEAAVAEAGDDGPAAPGAAGFRQSAGATPAAWTDATTVRDLGQYKVAVTGCPHCGQSEVVRWGKASGLPRYRCKACSRTFNALTKTRWRSCACARSGASRPVR